MNRNAEFNISEYENQRNQKGWGGILRGTRTASRLVVLTEIEGTLAARRSKTTIRGFQCGYYPDPVLEGNLILTL